VPDDNDCIHGMAPGTCSICSGRDEPTTGRPKRRRGSPGKLDSPEALEKYRERYLPDRKETFEAYVEVFFRVGSARNFPGGWTMFSRCANAEPALRRDEPHLVARAEEIMRLAGYEPDDSGRPRRGRRWLRQASE
jgi:hypothetical protein